MAGFCSAGPCFWFLLCSVSLCLFKVPYSCKRCQVFQNLIQYKTSWVRRVCFNWSKFHLTYTKKILASTISMPAYVLYTGPSYQRYSDEMRCILHKVEKRDHAGHVTRWHLVYYIVWMRKLGVMLPCVIDDVEETAWPYCYFDNLFIFNDSDLLSKKIVFML